MSQYKSIEQTADLYETEIIKGWEKIYRTKRARLFRLLSDYFRGESVLEMGVADGEMTRGLFDHFSRVTVVDASDRFLDMIRSRFRDRDLVLVKSYFEEFAPRERFDTIIMTHILEHLDDPVKVLGMARGWLTDNGRALISVPNADSLHRQIGVKMGLLERCDTLNDQDRKLGHRRVYTPQLMEAHLEEAGFRVVKFTGLMLKNLSNRQVEESWSDALIDAHFELGFDYPELCSEIVYIVER